MALVACPECGHQVAKTAVRCPNCGKSRPGGPMSLPKAIALGFLILVGIVVVLRVLA